MFKKIKQSILFKIALKSLAMKVTGAGLSFISGIFMARILGVSEFGTYALIFSFATLLGGLANLGMASYYTRETAILHSRNQLGEIIWLRKLADKMIKFSSVIFSIFGIIIIHYGWIGISWHSMDDFGWFAVLFIIPLFSLNLIRAAILRGIGRVIIADIPDMLIKPLIIIIVMYSGYVCDYKFYSSSLIWLQLFAVIVVLAISTFNLSRNVSGYSSSNTHEIKDHLFNRVTLIFFILSFVTLLQTKLPFYMTGYFLEPNMRVCFKLAYSW